MEERRREGARLIRQGKLSYSAIAEQLGVSRMAVSKWARQLNAGGLRQLRRRISSGRPQRLSPQQSRQLLRRLRHGAIAAGFSSEHWTLARIQHLIERECSVSFHACYLSRWLRSHGFSVQQPTTQAIERDDALVEAWLRQDWPRIKKSPTPWR